VMKIQVVVFCVVSLCSDVVGYQCSGGPCFTLKFESLLSSGTLVSWHISTWHHNPEVNDLVSTI
jgi:hypothetical protein